MIREITFHSLKTASDNTLKKRETIAFRLTCSHIDATLEKQLFNELCNNSSIYKRHIQ